jgi:hypothetical protein
MLLFDERTACITVVRVRWRDHLAARLGAARLDAALAIGESPDATVALALRARLLTGTENRRHLADGLQRALDEAQKPPAALIMRAPLNRAQILSASSELGELRRRLLADGPVAARGVAQARMLLNSGAGPLYRAGEPGQLATSVRGATDASAMFAPRSVVCD